LEKGGNYFLPPKQEALKTYRRIETLFTYDEEVKSDEEKQLEALINTAIARAEAKIWQKK